MVLNKLRYNHQYCTYNFTKKQIGLNENQLFKLITVKLQHGKNKIIKIKLTQFEFMHENTQSRS